MANPYFRNIPNFEYVNRTNADSKSSDSYIAVKNLFKKGVLRDDILNDVSVFEKYEIKGNNRPDNVAYEIYKDATLDWVILLANNILNVQDEWPMTQEAYDAYLLEKYGDYDTLYSGIHHYESSEVKNSQGIVIFPKGIKVDSTQSVSYYDFFQDLQVTVDNVAVPVTNYEYEERIENEKRTIYILKPKFLNIVFDDLEEIMTYKEGSTQYMNETLKRADNIRLYE